MVRNSMPRTLTTLLLAALVLSSGVAQNPLTKQLACVQSFDRVTSIQQAGLVPLGGAGSLTIVARPGGGRWLAMSGDIAFGIPVANGERLRLDLELQRDADSGGGGRWILGNDRDPQHGFSKVIAVGTDGGVSLCGRPTGVSLEADRPYRLTLDLQLVAPRLLLVESLRIRGKVDVTIPCGVTLASMGMLVSRHEGQGTFYLDNLGFLRR